MEMPRAVVRGRMERNAWASVTQRTLSSGVGMTVASFIYYLTVGSWRCRWFSIKGMNDMPAICCCKTVAWLSERIMSLKVTTLVSGDNDTRFDRGRGKCRKRPQKATSPVADLNAPWSSSWTGPWRSMSVPKKQNHRIDLRHTSYSHSPQLGNTDSPRKCSSIPKPIRLRLHHITNHRVLSVGILVAWLSQLSKDVE